MPMDEQLIINGKEYVTVTAAAELVGYSATYVEQLARGKWVDASNIHGTFYVSVDSLVRFVSLSEQQQADANAQEKVEQLWSTTPRDASDQWVMLSKAGIVTMCGVLVGVLVWAGRDAHLTGADVLAGVVTAWQLLAGTFGTAVDQMASSVVSVLRLW